MKPPTVPGRTPEQQALCDQFHREIGQALVDNLNANVRRKHPDLVPLRERLKDLAAAGGKITRVTLPRRKRYTVSAYDNFDLYDGPAWVDYGHFDDAAEAVACANSIIRRSLEGLAQANGRSDSDGLRMAYLCHGEVASIFGEPKVDFDPYKAVDWHIKRMTRGSADAP